MNECNVLYPCSICAQIMYGPIVRHMYGLSFAICSERQKRIKKLETSQNFDTVHTSDFAKRLENKMIPSNTKAYETTGNIWAYMCA